VIVVDTSAVVALLNREAPAEAITRALVQHQPLHLCAGTYAELVIVCGRRHLLSSLIALEERLGNRWQVLSLTPQRARRVGELHLQYGKGRHPAALNFGDCFALALVDQLQVPLLYVGQDFSQVPQLVAVPLA
jgi:ribonuclease VapC